MIPVRSSSNVNVDVAALVVETDGAHAEPSESGVDVLKHETQSNISMSFGGDCTVYYFYISRCTLQKKAEQGKDALACKASISYLETK